MNDQETFKIFLGVSDFDDLITSQIMERRVLANNSTVQRETTVLANRDTWKTWAEANFKDFLFVQTNSSNGFIIEERTNNFPSDYKERKLKEYKGIYLAYGYYWALFDNKMLNENGFIHSILAVDFRNKFLKEEFMRRYGSLDNFPENALDIIDEQQLFLEQMTQEAVEKTDDYKLKQEKIKKEQEQRKYDA